ncbi:MAG: diguanylate cyclase [gamma proteobacterium symbiont of Ctena orbiculata]|nr:MAG: diguanylate cyclase [gamma proteobacterium symbiont of Ctena orbiculata]
MNYKKLAFLLLTAWCLVVLASLGWNINHTQAEHQHFLKDTARLVFDHIALVREWNANHGGVYVPVSESTPPNRYLEVENREIVVDDRLTLTMVNPAYMTRQVAELATRSNGIQLHITSLNPIRPENSPSELEREALLFFESGESEEFSRLLAKKSGYRFFYMAPLMTTRACLRCHEKQGYVEGDLRGGISVTIPDVHPAPIQGIVIGHSLIGAIGFIAIITLSQRLSASYERVHRQSIIDALTGIPNRRHFIDRLIAEYRRSSRNSTPLTLMICDIDFFKRYNDSLGHLEGDDCIVRVAKTINTSLQRGGDLCARFGGEEFIVILPNTDLAGGEKIARRIQQEIAALAITHPDSPIGEFITLSFGLAADVDEYPSQDYLIKRADDALYRSKQSGRNRIECDPKSRPQPSGETVAPTRKTAAASEQPV